MIYTVKSGDNLGYIAEWYKVRLSDLRYWNNVHRNLIRGGQKLVIYKPKGSAKTYANINSMSFAEKQRFTGRNRKPVTLSSSTPVTSYSDSEYEYYTVRRGDNLYDIARRYPGISNKDIIKVNGLNKSGHIFPGQKLKIPRKG